MTEETREGLGSHKMA